jgi:hypothetical protein
MVGTSPENISLSQSSYTNMVIGVGFDAMPVENGLGCRAPLPVGILTVVACGQLG